jgi:hypothetical protein
VYKLIGADRLLSVECGQNIYEPAAVQNILTKVVGRLSLENGPVAVFAREYLGTVQHVGVVFNQQPLCWRVDLELITGKW